MDNDYVRVVKSGESEVMFSVSLEEITDTRTKHGDNSANEKWKYDADYIRYVESGESAAVFVVRDVVKAVDTRGKWVDIVSMSSNLQDKDGWNFNWIVAEIFPRKINPDYSECKTVDEKKYLTWQTAHEDISQQRANGYSGPKFLVLCSLNDKNKGKSIKWKLTGIIYKYSNPDGKIREVEREPNKPESITEKLPHDWEYKITYLKRLNNSQVKYIQSHSIEIEDKIIISGKHSPEIFVPDNSKGDSKNAKAKQA